MIAVHIALMLLLAGASYIDIRHHRIPNWTVMVIAMGGLAANFLVFGQTGLYFGLSGCLAGLLPMLAIHFLTGIGAGDVKLLAAVGAVVGVKAILAIFCYSFLVSGLWAIALLAWNRGFKDMAYRYFHLLAGLTRGRIDYQKPAANTVAASELPMAPGIALATGYVLWPQLETALVS